MNYLKFFWNIFFIAQSLLAFQFDWQMHCLLSIAMLSQGKYAGIEYQILISSRRKIAHFNSSIIFMHIWAGKRHSERDSERWGEGDSDSKLRQSRPQNVCSQRPFYGVIQLIITRFPIAVTDVAGSMASLLWLLCRILLFFLHILYSSATSSLYILFLVRRRRRIEVIT